MSERGITELVKMYPERRGLPRRKFADSIRESIVY